MLLDLCCHIWGPSSSGFYRVEVASLQARDIRLVGWGAPLCEGFASATNGWVIAGAHRIDILFGLRGWGASRLARHFRTRENGTVRSSKIFKTNINSKYSKHISYRNQKSHAFSKSNGFGFIICF